MRLEEAAQLALNDQRRFVERAYHVPDKDTGLAIPFLLKETQKIIYNEILRLRETQDGIVRLILLKARREGASSLVTALGLTNSLFRPGHQFRMVAHDEDGYTTLFRMVQTYYDSFAKICPEVKKRLPFETKATSKGEWVWAHGGGVRVATVNNPDAVRSSAAHFLHLSEAAHFPRDVAERLITAAKPIVPMAANTHIIVESTASGMDNLFYELWKEARQNERDQEDGKAVWSHWRPLFIPWYKEPTYRLSGIKLVPEVPMSSERADDFLAEEEELRGMYGLDDEQLVYRRYMIFGEYGGDVDKFRQEYPSNDVEAFIASGGKVFDRLTLAAYLEEARSAESGRYELGYPPNGGGLRKTPHPHGKYEIHFDPKPKKAYLIAADPAEGGLDSDSSAAVVLGLINGRVEEVATYEGKLDEFSFAADLIRLAEFYNWAIICPERSAGAGKTLIRALTKRHSYPYLWSNMDLLRTSRPSTDQVGMPVNSEPAKAQVITELRSALLMNAIRPRSERTILQMLDYTSDEKGRYHNASRKGHDDLVMAMAIGITAWNTNPPTGGGAGYGAKQVFSSPALEGGAGYGAALEDVMF